MHHRPSAPDIFLSYYGDDFTGSADVMEALTLNGVPTALFLQPPEPQEVADFDLKADFGAARRLRAFGVAGVARSLSPAEMDEQLPAIFEKISRIPARFFQYKVCSTFDSAPHIGSIGHAAEIALRYFPSPYIPLVIGAPLLNRFVVFGNLFARVGQTTYRLDRHPTMSRHPVTPMAESDLRRHLVRQTSRNVHLLDVFALEGQYGPPLTMLKKLMEEEGQLVLFDTLHPEHLQTVGQLLMAHSGTNAQLIVGASGADHALAAGLQEQGRIQKPEALPHPGQVERMVVMAGSCSQATAAQIDHMAALGHTVIRLDSRKLIDPVERSGEMEAALTQAADAFGRGQVPVLYSAKGPDDPAIEATKDQLRGQENGHSAAGAVLGSAQGVLLRELIRRVGKLRIAVAGGDTSGYVTRALGIYALEFRYPMAPGSPLCVAHAKDGNIDGLEIALKGGQAGNERYFESVLRGELLD